MRDIPAEALALGEAGGGAVRVLIQTTIEGVTYNFIDEPEAAIELDGVVYQGLADGAVRFSGVPDGGGMEASRFALTIDSAGMLLGDAAEAPAEILSHISDYAYQGAEVDVDFAIGTGINGSFVTVIEGIAGRFTGLRRVAHLCAARPGSARGRRTAPPFVQKDHFTQRR